MAPDTAIAPAAARSLASMTKISPCVYFYRPETPSAAPPTTDTASSSKTPPKLVILATWMGARDPHIAKYLAQYQALFPTAPILLLRSEPRHFIRPGSAASDFAPAVPCVRAIFPNLGTGSSGTASSASVPAASSDSLTPLANEAAGGEANRVPQLLLHAWSNGGASSLLHLRRALNLSPEATATAETSSVPPYTLVLDSTPGAFRYLASYRAFTAGLSGAALWLAAPLVHALCLWYWLRHAVLGRGRTGPLAALRRGLNDALARRAEVRRAYVYGPGDRLVDWRDVEAHAADAERAGFAAVRRERFEGSEHVAHARVDAERYWRVARETWEGVV
ncbi:hypothetical protein C7999DRAFT_34546 [Corynascus novoguineensis]|uniref:Indole-diterpene biosynthesis protein PaxU n=1 Tax=Corynascus novoguineensis TaxID=1126955 RepID=A0AAN7CN08_9PEZI|nr:hypothetical protein C7999DRAFT_34546 [Corynascus novoguineensis]